MATPNKVTICGYYHITLFYVVERFCPTYDHRGHWHFAYRIVGSLVECISCVLVCLVVTHTPGINKSLGQCFIWSWYKNLREHLWSSINSGKRCGCYSCRQAYGGSKNNGTYGKYTMMMPNWSSKSFLVCDTVYGFRHLKDIRKEKGIIPGSGFMSGANMP